MKQEILINLRTETDFFFKDIPEINIINFNHNKYLVNYGVSERVAFDNDENFLLVYEIKEMFKNRLVLWNRPLALQINEKQEAIKVVELQDIENWYKIKFPNYQEYLYEDALWQLLLKTDYISMSGREKLLENIINSSDILKNNLDIPTKEISYNFLRYIGSSKKDIPLEQVIGTDHPNYKGKSWIELYKTLKHPDTFLREFSKCITTAVPPDSDEELNQGTGISFHEINGKYYISEGNHRTTFAKLKGLRSIRNKEVSIFTYDEDYIFHIKELQNLGFKVEYESETCLRQIEKYKWEKLEIYLEKTLIISLNNIDDLKNFHSYFVNMKTDWLSSIFNKPFERLIDNKKTQKILIAYKRYLEIRDSICY